MNDRTPLNSALSNDLKDRTYPYRRNVAEGPHDYAYPLAIQAKEGAFISSSPHTNAPSSITRRSTRIGLLMVVR